MSLEPQFVHARLHDVQRRLRRVGPARLRNQTVLIDAASGVVVCGGLLGLDLATLEGRDGAAQFVVAALCAAALSTRRVLPILTTSVAAIVLALQLAQTSQARAVDAVLLVVLYSCWAWGSIASRIVALGLSVVAASVAASVSPFTVGATAFESSVIISVTVLLAALGACGLGLLTRTRLALAEQMRLRAERAEADQRRLAELAVERERARMSRDVHDIVAHSLTVIAVQAQAGSFAAGTDDPTDARTSSTLDSIATTAKQALTEVRDVLRALSPGEGGLSAEELHLEPMVEQAREAGMTVRVRQCGTPRALPAPRANAIELMTREALTNSLRHAGPEARVDITLTWATDELTVVIEDSGGTRPGISVPGRGLGLRGMRQRMDALGGRVEHGPNQDGFSVAVTLPVP